MPHPILKTMQLWSTSILITLWRRNYYLHFTDKENQGTEKLHNMSNITQQGSGGAGI